MFARRSWPGMLLWLSMVGGALACAQLVIELAFRASALALSPATSRIAADYGADPREAFDTIAPIDAAVISDTLRDLAFEQALARDPLGHPGPTPTAGSLGSAASWPTRAPEQPSATPSSLPPSATPAGQAELQVSGTGATTPQPTATRHHSPAPTRMTTPTSSAGRSTATPALTPVLAGRATSMPSPTPTNREPTHIPSTPTATQAQPTETPKPTEKPAPTETPRPTKTPEPTRTPKPTRTPRPTEPPEPTKTPKSTRTPEPTRTPKPPKWPKPTKTPKPVAMP